MRGRVTTLTLLLAAGTLLMLEAVPTTAQDRLLVSVDTVKLKYENERVRVLEVTIPPGVREEPHSHPPYLTYVVSGGRGRVHLADGTTLDDELETGDVRYSDAVTHWGENVGDTVIRLLVVELKTEGGKPDD